MKNTHLITWLLTAILSINYPAIASEQNKEEPNNQVGANDLGLILQKHPDQAKFDFSSKSEGPVVLEGKVITKVESVDSEDAGEYEVEIASGITLVDKKRKRIIPLEVAYPKGNQAFPIILFSHSTIASGRDYRSLAAYWASHGYVTISPTHKDALSLNIKPGQKVGVFKLLKLAKTKLPELNERALDLALTASNLKMLGERIDGIKESTIAPRIGLIGDHTGATTVELLNDVSIGGKKLQSNSMPEVHASICFVRANWGLPRLKKMNWSNASSPVMVVSFSNPRNNQLKIRKQFTTLLKESQSQNKYLVTVDSEKFKKPPRKRLRKMIRESNIELISFRPFRRFRKTKTKSAETSTNDPQISNMDPGELPGGNLRNILGLPRLNQKSDDMERFKFAMSATVPFLDAYLKADQSALEKLSTPSMMKYEDAILIKTSPVSQL